MNVLVTGAGGLLGTAVVEHLEGLGRPVTPLSRAQLDVLDGAAVRHAVSEAQPTVVVHCAAYTAVDAAEEDTQRAFDVNEGGARTVAEAAAEVGALVVYPSTDYVFDGTSTRPYRPDDPVAPINAYGRSKLAGERAVQAVDPRHLIVRTSWLYGPGGRNFVDTMVALGRERDRLQVVDDQVGRPTWAPDLAAWIVALADLGATGTLHGANRGRVSWHGLATEALALAGIEAIVESVSSAHFGAPAPRPAFSVLDVSATETLLGRALPHWAEALRRHMSRTLDRPASKPTLAPEAS